ncbi:hypothetical protein HH214_09120 [Mucilaginibacter robiniae]|uniref:PRTRC system protein F n=1 Tax=Mucilaginibacter robiniae TaxID=2728022 RepID=A0A7L5DYD8_9SPHI|nr:hypothetical protein [Mucilaginibacter robiniae]QJD96025.1 hypothetical protein HH214_09120 [Mucilaginibacter robiniae]
METASANRNCNQRYGQAAGCAGSPGPSAALRTPAPAADGFLNHCFVPKYEQAAGLPKRAAVEGDFFRSLAHLRKHYGVPVTNHRQQPYPYNILLAMQEIANAIRQSGRERQLFIIAQDNGPLCLTVREHFQRDYFAYYIPVVPIYQIWQQPEQQASAELLTAVCAYLHTGAGISYYRDSSSYMHYNYEILQEWAEEGEACESGSYTAQMEDYGLAVTAGDFMQEKMQEARQRLPELIAAFQPQTSFDVSVMKVAQATLRLEQQFPEGNLFAHASEPEDDEDYGYNNEIYMHEYIGFVASTTDALGQMLVEMVENDFNERSAEQEPQLITHFTQRQAPYRDELAYERAVFSLIDDLCTLL